MQCIVVKSDEFENSLPLYIFPLNPDYVAARSLRSLRSNYALQKSCDCPIVSSFKCHCLSYMLHVPAQVA